MMRIIREEVIPMNKNKAQKRNKSIKENISLKGTNVEVAFSDLLSSLMSLFNDLTLFDITLDNASLLEKEMYSIRDQIDSLSYNVFFN